MEISLLNKVPFVLSRRRQMINKQLASTEESEFGKKCRLALEQRWGMNIPAPKNIATIKEV